jgi:hypothetical protein
MKDSEKMNILMVVGRYYPFLGGAESQAKLLAENLAKEKCDVTVLTERSIRGTKREEKINGVKVIRTGLFPWINIPGINRLKYYLFSIRVFFSFYSEAKTST